MSNNTIKVNFLEVEQGGRKSNKYLHAFILGMLVISMSLVSVFFVLQNSLACCPCCHGDITIIKATDPSGSDQKFNFSGDLCNFSLMDGESKDFIHKSTRHYDITEAITTGWELTAIICTGDDDYSVDLANRTVTIDLDHGENVVCTFYNSEDAPKPYCGDGNLDPGEDCDDGADGDDTNQCYDNCTLTYCGDSIIQNPNGYDGNEQCDDGPDGSETCTPNCTLIEEPEYVTIKAFKIVCEDETDLPDWGNGGPNITADTAQDYVDDSQGKCYLATNWYFQWGFGAKCGQTGVKKLDGAHIGEADGSGGSGTNTGTGYNDWKNFTTYTGETATSAQVQIDDMKGANKLWVRENLQSGYIPFTNPPQGVKEDNFTAELYCHNDVENYDNYDYINNALLGETYYCVGFNTLTDTPPEQGTLIVKKLVVDGQATSSDWTMHIGDSIDFPGSASGTANVLDVGMYQVTESGDPGNYELTYSGDCGETGLVSIGADETKTCILTNTYQEQPPKWGSITVCKYEDLDGLASTTEDRATTTNIWTFTLDDGATTTIQETENGCTVFTNLEAGSYDLSEELLSGWRVLKPAGGTTTVSLCPGQNKTVNFVNYQVEEPELGSIKVCKYEDEDGLASTTDDRATTTSVWTFSLNDGATTTPHNTVNGCTLFNGLNAGDYTITETLLSNWYFLESADGTATTTLSEGEDKQINFINYYQEPEHYCGDGHLDEGEECDDGNNVNGDGCNASCRYEYRGGGGGGGIYLQILDLEAHCITENSAVVNWRTNKTATSWVVYGIDSDAQEDATSTETTVSSTQHSMVIDGLTPYVDYFFEAVSKAGSKEVRKTVTYNTNSCVQVKGEEGKPTLTISKTIDQEFANPGDKDITYTIVLNNIGNLTAFDVTLTDTLPTGLTYTESSSTIQAWELGDFAPGANKIVKYLVNVDDTVLPGIYTNTAEVKAANHGPVSATADLEVREVKVLPITGFSFNEFLLMLISAISLLGVSTVMKRKFFTSNIRPTAQ